MQTRIMHDVYARTHTLCGWLRGGPLSMGSSPRDTVVQIRSPSKSNVHMYIDVRRRPLRKIPCRRFFRRPLSHAIMSFYRLSAGRPITAGKCCAGPALAHCSRHVGRINSLLLLRTRAREREPAALSTPGRPILCARRTTAAAPPPSP